jgi:hypothetical protein
LYKIIFKRLVISLSGRVAEYSPNPHKALGSICSTAKKFKKNFKKERKRNYLQVMCIGVCKA